MQHEEQLSEDQIMQLQSEAAANALSNMGWHIYWGLEGASVVRKCASVGMTPRLIVYCARGIGNEPQGVNVHPIGATFDAATKSAVIIACPVAGQGQLTFKWQQGKVFDASGEYIAFIASQFSPKIYEALAMTPEWTV